MKQIYIVTDGEYYKIGFTSDIDKRLKQIQTGNAKKIEYIKGYETKYANRIEEELHSIFAKKKIKGEWFLLNKKDISIIDDYIKDNGDIYKPLVKLSNEKKFMKKWIDRKVSKLITDNLRDVDLGFLYKIEAYIDEENVIDFKRFKLDYKYSDSKLSKSKKPLLDTGIIKEHNTLIYLNPLVGIIGKEIKQELIEIFDDTFKKYSVQIN